MAEFSGKVVSASFMDAEHTLIKVRYDNNGQLEVFNLSVDPDHQDYKDLVAEGWDTQSIIAETAELKKAESLAFNLMVNDAANKIIEETRDTLKSAMYAEVSAEVNADVEDKLKAQRKLDKNKTPQENLLSLADAQLDKILDFLEKDESKDNLFKVKLWILEREEAKKASKEVKAKIRKCTSILEGLAILQSLK